MPMVGTSLRSPPLPFWQRGTGAGRGRRLLGKRAETARFPLGDVQLWELHILVVKPDPVSSEKISNETKIKVKCLAKHERHQVDPKVSSFLEESPFPVHTYSVRFYGYGLSLCHCDPFSFWCFNPARRRTNQKLQGFFANASGFCLNTIVVFLCSVREARDHAI